ncbi:tubulin epsilon and delta complex protein 1 [Periophthalmus magnuspinnatus]|uniref:tubulin epsilon and delta complex protein 1 n=1 Tax=Periophthalmus magnuspinnatus TaxID=409849 RepID=UPI002436842A|nr:tubulin epsilon and delta complex protein 1 [Periophthalmus magnuspinnatus]
MQKSKACASVEVKQVIVALCNLLSAAALGSVPAPETFRRAKFGGGPDVEEHLWELLSNILEKTDPVSLAVSQRYQKTERWKLVAAGLWQTGYYADWMYREPRGAERGACACSSRDLLLALGWLMAKGALEKILSQRVEELDKTLLTSTPVNLESSVDSSDLQLDSNSLRRLQWSLGSLRHKGRILLSMQEERARLLHKVLNMDLPSHVNTVSSDEGSALITKDCACLQELCDLLEAYLKWKQVESIFWIWMDSVMDCHQADLDARKCIQAPKQNAVCLHGNRGLEKLEGILQRLPQPQAGPSRVDTKHHVIDGAEGGVDPSLLLHPEPSLLPVYRPKLLKPGTKLDPKPSPVSLLEVCAAEAIELLAQREVELVMERDRRRRESREKLEEMLEGLEGLVLIPL